MFIKTWNGWNLEDAKQISQKCEHCGNTTEHFVYIRPHGPQVGIVFMKKPLLSKKQYLLVCPTCNFVAKELTKEQAYAMQDKNS